MAELTPIEKLKIIEDNFQKWFRKAYELKDYTDVDIDYIVANLPDAKLQMQRREGLSRYLYYKARFKNTIKVPPQFQDTPKLFINTLGKYFVDSAKFLYKDQIRYEYLGAPSSNPGEKCNIAVYKSCADEVGCFMVQFHLEGNLIVAEVGYQIFGQMMSLCSEPMNLRSFSAESLNRSGRGKMFRYYPKTFFDWMFSVITGLVIILWLLASCSFFMYEYVEGRNKNQIIVNAIVSLVASAFFALPAFITLGLLQHCLDFARNTIFSNPDKRLARQIVAIQQDLSPIHFPVKYFNHEDLYEAYTNSHDHQIFFKQLESVVNQMSALGESANRA